MSQRGRNAKQTTHESDNDPEKRYCICRTPYKEEQFMIQCDGCDDWFHGECVDVTPDMANSWGPEAQWFCPNCIAKGKGPNPGRPAPQQPAPKQPQKDLRAEVVKHMEKLLKQSLKTCQEIVDQQITSGTAPGENQTVLSEEELNKLKEQAKQLVDLAADAGRIHQMAVEIEESIKANRGTERDKPYRNQYRGVKGKLNARSEYQYHLQLFTGERKAAELGADDLSAYVEKEKEQH